MLTAALDGLVERFGLAGRAGRRGGRRCGAQARARLQPDPRVGARLEAGAGDPRDRHPAGLRHRPPGGDPGREQDRPRRSIDVGIAGGTDTTSDAPVAISDKLRRKLMKVNAAREHQGQGRRARRDPARGHRAGDPAEQRAAHPAVDGRARRAHRAGVADRPRGAGRARRRVAPAPGGGVRPRLPRRPAHAVPRRRRATRTCAPTRRSRSSPSSSRSSGAVRPRR